MTTEHAAARSAGAVRSGDLFVWQRALRSCDLPREVRATLLMLSTWMDRHAAGAHPSLPMLADAVGCHVATIKRHLAVAEDAGWIARTPGGGRGRATTYAATVPADAGEGTVPADEETGARVRRYEERKDSKNGRTDAPVSVEERAHGCTETGAPVYGNRRTHAPLPEQDHNNTTPQGAHPSGTPSPDDRGGDLLRDVLDRLRTHGVRRTNPDHRGLRAACRKAAGEGHTAGTLVRAILAADAKLGPLSALNDRDRPDAVTAAIAHRIRQAPAPTAPVDRPRTVPAAAPAAVAATTCPDDIVLPPRIATARERRRVS